MSTTTFMQIEVDALAPNDAAEAFRAEVTLASEINELWSQHVAAENTIKHTQEELRVIRQVLAKKLYAMKQLLAKPGRNGKWASFLNDRNIARATADRYVKEYEKLLNPPAPEPEPSSDERPELHQPATEPSTDKSSAPEPEGNRLREAISAPVADEQTAEEPTSVDGFAPAEPSGAIDAAWPEHKPDARETVAAPVSEPEPNPEPRQPLESEAESPEQDLIKRFRDLLLAPSIFGPNHRAIEFYSLIYTSAKLLGVPHEVLSGGAGITVYRNRTASYDPYADEAANVA